MVQALTDLRFWRRYQCQF